jgi:hypothetical protein
MMDYIRLISEAADLMQDVPGEDWEGNEYLRGILELVSRAYPYDNVDTEQRARMVAAEIAAICGVNP